MPILTNNQGNPDYNKRMRFLFLLFRLVKIIKDCCYPSWQDCEEMDILIYSWWEKIITAFSGGPFCNIDFFNIEEIYSYKLEEICTEIFITIFLIMKILKQ